LNGFRLSKYKAMKNSKPVLFIKNNQESKVLSAGGVTTLPVLADIA
jgi:hypothetical protein